MSLNVNFARVVNYQDIPASHMDAISYYCMFLDIGQITADNVDEVYFRYLVYSKINGQLMLDPNGNSKVFPKSWFKQFVGFRCNVATTTRAAFMTRMKKGLEQVIKDEIRREELLDKS